MKKPVFPSDVAPTHDKGGAKARLLPPRVGPRRISGMYARFAVFSAARILAASAALRTYSAEVTPGIRAISNIIAGDPQ